MKSGFAIALFTILFAMPGFKANFAWGAPPAPPHLDKHSFGDDTPILSSALQIDSREYEKYVEAGVTERMQVYFYLFKMMVFEEKFPAEVEAIVPQKIVERILREEGYDLAALRELYKGKNAKDLNLFYGPDLIKSNTGTWYSLEDNFGTGMGGFGDAQLIHDDFRKRHQLSKERSALADFKHLFGHFFKTYGVNPQTSRVVAFVPPDEAPGEYVSFEYTRLKNLFLASGIEVMNPNDLSFAQKEDLLKNPPTAILNTVDPMDDPSRDFIYQELFRKRKIPLYISPGSITLSNKAFLPFINPLAQQLGFHHTAANPLIISSPRSVLLDNGLPENLNEWVIKEAFGASGDQVYMAKFMTEAEREALRQHYKQSKGLFIGQQLIASDTFDTPYGRFIYDIRPLVHLTAGQLIYVTPTPWARASQTNKVNISKGGANLVILKTPRCVDLFH